MPDSTHGRFVVSVLVGDRTGILRDISAALTGIGATIDGVSQTVVDGYFTVIMTACFDSARAPGEIREAILGRFAADEAEVVVKPYGADRPPRYAAEGERYILTLTGPRHPELFKSLTEFLASREVNVEDWYMSGAGALVTHVGEVSVPRMLDIKQLQDELTALADAMDARVHIQHENIFRATNDIGPIKPLLRAGPC